MNNDPTFTISDVISRVRKLKSDATYASTDCRLWIFDALMELYTQAPKTRKTETDGVRDLPDFFTADTDIVPCSLRYLPLIVDYVMGRAFMQDGDSQEHSARSAQHFQLFFQRAHWVEFGPQGFNEHTQGVVRGRP